MSVLKRVLRAFGWMVLGTVLLLVALVAVLLVVNRHDQPPSPLILELQAAIDSRPPAADADNAYVYALGMNVAKDADPSAEGSARLQWQLTAAPGAGFAEPWPPKGVVLKEGRSEAVQALSDACRRLENGCGAALAKGNETIGEWLASENWLLERYKRLLAHPRWRETVPQRLDARSPAYDHAAEGQRLLLVQAWLLAGRGDVAAVRETLQQDARFWRMVLGESDGTFSKIVAVSMLRRNLALGSLVIQRLPSSLASAAVPPAWTADLTLAERSIRRPLASEVLFLDAQLKVGFPLPELEEKVSAWQRLQRLASQILLQPQDTSNRNAAARIADAEAMDAPYERLREAYERATKPGDGPFPRHLYNPYGDILLAIAGPAYAGYGLKTADLEGSRRLALLAADLRARDANLAELPNLVKNSALRDPYTGQAFVWDGRGGELVFNGLQPGERGRYVIPYQAGN